MKQAVARIVDSGCIALAAAVSAHVPGVLSLDKSPLQVLFVIAILLSSTGLLSAAGGYVGSPARGLRRLCTRLLPAWLGLQCAGLLLLLSTHRQNLALLPWIAWWTAIGATLLASWRLAAVALRTSARRSGQHARNVVAVSSGAYQQQNVATIEPNPHSGFASLDALDIPSVNPSPCAISNEATTGKEIFDRAFALAALIGLGPIFVVIAIAIKLSSPGPVFFRQHRKGLNGRPFSIYKFRSMRVHTEEPGIVRQATRNDSRITTVGHFLRRTSLDELPQFINVLRGEMSIVGPRPHALEHDDLYEPLISGYLDRYRIKPGITGWAQINGYRGETAALEKMARRVEYDLYYLRHRSFWMDIKIVLRTVVRGFFSKQAY